MIVMPGDKTLNAILVRHGETEANKDGIAQGQTDTPLTGEGVASTLRKAAKLARFAFSAIYSSDLQRAVTTAELLKKAIGFSKPVSLSSDLREIDFGALSGKSREEIMPIVRHHKADPSLRYPGGEGGADLIARTERFFAEARVRHVGESILVVTHYGVMETVAKRFAGFPPDEPVVIGSDDVWLLELGDGGARFETAL
ncbi:MAG: histidine phosphatase family protein [Nitrospinae bacterium]|nr:histidine phosphatase family protein [Nitrospinota bacterium]